MSVEVDTSGLRNMLRDFESIDVDAVIRGCQNQLMARLLRDVIKNTPVGKRPDNLQMYQKVKAKTGELKKNGKPKTRTMSFLTGQGLAWQGYRGGTLRRGWTAAKEHPEFVHYGDTYLLRIVNPTYYGDYVEHGHRQRKGRFVPAIGKRLVRSYVPGLHFVQRAEENIGQSAEAITEKYVQKILRERLKNDQ